MKLFCFFDPSFREKRSVCALSGVLACILLLCACTPSWQKKLEQGQRQMEQEEYAQAAVLFGEAAQERHPEGYLYRGDAYAALAEREEGGSERRALYYANALEDYRTARESLGDGETLPRLTALYFAIGDEALSLSDYDGAEGYYAAVLEWNHADADAYGRLADVSMARGRTLEAAARLEKGVTATHNEVLSKRLAELRAMFDAKELETRRLAAAQALLGVPYYGDTGQCTMGPEQALAYARLIADGLSGKFQGFTGYGRPLYNGQVYWDEPYAVLGLGSYETDRSRVMLGDFAGDGNPYLYLFSSVVDEKSFEVYGWKDGAVRLAAGVEAFGSQREGRLAVTASGTVVLEESEPTGERSRSGRTIRFLNGGTGVAGLRDETWDPSEEAVRVTANGVPSTYSEEAWASRERLSTKALDAVSENAFSLRQMLDALNGYAEALGSSPEDLVAAPPEHSDRHRMATAMLRRLFALNRLSVEETGTRLCDTRLLDLDRDGREELFAAFQGEYLSEAGLSCQFALYHWEDGELEEYPGGAGLDELHLARYESEYGILGAGRDPDLPLTQSLTEQDTSDPSAGQDGAQIQEPPENAQEGPKNERNPQEGIDTGGGENIAQNAQKTPQRGFPEDSPENSPENADSPVTEDQREEEPLRQTAGDSRVILYRQETGEAAEPSSPGPTDTSSRGQNTEPYTLRYSYTFLSHSEELVMDADGDRRAYHVVRSGRSADIAESEFASIRGRYTVLQTLVNYRTSDMQNRNYAAVISALFRMQAEE